MKILKFLLLALLLVVLVGVGTAYAVPEIEYTVSVDVERPVGEVWAAFHDPETTTAWIEGLQSVELVEGERGAEGAKYRMVFEENGEQVVFSETIETVVPHERFVFTTTHEIMDMYADTRFEPKGDGATTVTSTVTMAGQNLVTRAMMPLMKGKIAERQRGDLERLAALVEGDA